MSSKKISNELVKVFDYIKSVLLEQYGMTEVTIPFFLLAILEQEDCVAYKSLSKITFTDNIETLKSIYKNRVASSDNVIGTTFDEYIELAGEEAVKMGADMTNSGILLCSILFNDALIAKDFKDASVTYKQLLKTVKTETKNFTETNKTTKAVAVIAEKKQPTNTSVMRPTRQPMNDVERNLINLNVLAAEDKINHFYTTDDTLFNTIFTKFSKKCNNNIVITGKHGVGKTTLVMELASRLASNNVPEPFKGKFLMQLDFASLISGTMFRGAFESKFKPIIEEARKQDKYIFFIDDIHTLTDSRNKVAETDTVSILNMMLDEKNIPFICTTSEGGYSTMISENPSLLRKLQKLTINEPSEIETEYILNNLKKSFEDYHNVRYNTDCIRDCVKLSKRYVTDKSLPDSAIDIIDEAGAKTNLMSYKDSTLEKLYDELNDLKLRELAIKANSIKKDYDLIDAIIKQQIQINSKISIYKKEKSFNSEPVDISSNTIRNIVSTKTGVPLEEMTINDKEKLKNINNVLKECVIGQDTAVDEVCRVVKRQRIGLANPTKPSVFFFGGLTGTGKTLLAKKLAEKVFGDEKYLVRLDMSEYSDKTSVSKLHGSSPGYIGYEKGGVLSEAIKKKKYCVLLLDEIEKADEEVHNMFLQIFDDGRMTDNHGTEIDFKNVIVIMTSNVGASEVTARGNGVGFVTDKKSLSESIISNELKRKFKPEFLNRIDKLIYFNRLTEDNLKKIILLEITKVAEKIKNIGYGISEELPKQMTEVIYDKIKDKQDFGARPIIREVQTMIEDRITDIIINDEVENNHIFTYKDIVVD